MNADCQTKHIGDNKNITDIAAVASVHKREKGEMFLRGAMFVWECLRVQDEVDDMNQEWGI